MRRRHPDGKKQRAAKISADFEQQFQRLAHLVRIAGHIRVEQRLAHDLQRDAHHLLMDVAFFAGPPVFQRALRVAHHGFRIGGDARAVKRRLRQPPLPQPETVFAGQQSFAKKYFIGEQHAPFVKLARVRDQHILDVVRMIDKKTAERVIAHPGDVAVGSRAMREKSQWIARHLPELPAELLCRSGIRPRRKFFPGFRRCRHRGVHLSPGGYYWSIGRIRLRAAAKVSALYADGFSSC